MRLNKIGEMQFEQILDIFLDPEAAKATLAHYKKAREEATKAVDAANIRHYELDEREVALHQFEVDVVEPHRKAMAAERAAIVKANADLDSKSSALASDMAKLKASLAQLAADTNTLQTRQQAFNQRENDLLLVVKAKMAEADKAMAEARDMMAAAEARSHAAEAMMLAVKAREDQLRKALG